MKKSLSIPLSILTAISLTACSTIGGGSTLTGTNKKAIVTVSYPEMIKHPQGEEADGDAFYDSYSTWEKSQYERLRKLEDAEPVTELHNFWKENLRLCLTSDSDDDENTLCSPVNIYLALSMLAEVTEGESRNQILDAMGLSTIEESRALANRVFTDSYIDDGATTTVLANSFWMNDSVSYKKAVLQTLAEKYYASSFSGKMGTEEYDNLLHEWMNENTGNLLEDQINGIKMPEDGILSLVSTINYKAKWGNEFWENNNTKEVFHGADGDERVTFMNGSADSNYYWSDQFSAVHKSMDNDEATMWLILPDEGISPDQLFASDEIYDLILNTEEWENVREPDVNLSIPKFDLNTQLDLTDYMQEIGIQDVFTPGQADFSALTDAEAVLSEATHGIRVAIDEEGITAAAYTVMMLAGCAMPPEEIEEIDFVVDRPFIFVMTNAAGYPLFAGVVNTVQ